MTTLATYSQIIDDLFVSTWQNAKRDAVNNIIAAIPVFEALKAAGCMTSQVGGDLIKRDIFYGVGSKTYITRGSVLPIETPDLMTQASWKWRYFAAAITRNIIEDQQNSGEAQRRNLVANRLEAARRACIEGIETDLFGITVATASSPYEDAISAFQGLNELVPPYGYYGTGYYGNIARSNSWWQCKYQALSTNPEVSLIDDMQQLWMKVSQNMESPNLIIATEALFRIYLSFGLNISQIVKDEGGRLVDLGYEVARFNGKPMIYQALAGCTEGSSTVPSAVGASANDAMLMLNTNYIELVNDPNMWFDMTEWKRAPRDPNAVAHILSCLNLITTQPRRHGRLYTAYA
jgi:hypothetical protein